jgi:hypothetical protein
MAHAQVTFVAIAQRYETVFCWAAVSGPMRCLDDDVVRDATIEQMSQAVFSANPLGALGDYISRPTKLNADSVSMGTSVVQAVQLRSSIV